MSSRRINCDADSSLILWNLLILRNSIFEMFPDSSECHYYIFYENPSGDRSISQTQKFNSKFKIANVQLQTESSRCMLSPSIVTGNLFRYNSFLSPNKRQHKIINIQIYVHDIPYTPISQQFIGAPKILVWFFSFQIYQHSLVNNMFKAIHLY